MLLKYKREAEAALNILPSNEKTGFSQALLP